jgi:hypothetical protein
LGKCDGFGGKDKEVGEDVTCWVEIVIYLCSLFCFEILNHKLKSNDYIRDVIMKVKHSKPLDYNSMLVWYYYLTYYVTTLALGL